jgi:hypothetical protein
MAAQQPGIERIVTHGNFELDGGSWEVDNNIWIVGDSSEVIVIDAAHDAKAIEDAVAGRHVVEVGPGPGGLTRALLETAAEQVVAVAIAQYFLKTGWEVLATPLTYQVVGWLKRKENEDHYDRDTDFSPFRVKV